MREEINWPELAHFQGLQVVDFPRMQRLLESKDAAERGMAATFWGEWPWESAQVYGYIEALPQFVDWALGLLSQPNPEAMEVLIDIGHCLSRCWTNREFYSGRRFDFCMRVAESIRSGANTYMSLLGHPDPDIRTKAASLVSGANSDAISVAIVRERHAAPATSMLNALSCVPPPIQPADLAYPLSLECPPELRMAALAHLIRQDNCLPSPWLKGLSIAYADEDDETSLFAAAQISRLGDTVILFTQAHLLDQLEAASSSQDALAVRLLRHSIRRHYGSGTYWANDVEWLLLREIVKCDELWCIDETGHLLRNRGLPSDRGALDDFLHFRTG